MAVDAKCSGVKPQRIGDVEYNQQQMEEFREAFEAFDIDGDGTISCQELGTVFLRIGERMTDQELQDMVKEVDADSSGTIDFEEFITMMATRTSDQNKIQKVFNVFDKNQDGFISSIELAKVMGDLGEKLSEEEVSEMMRWADKDGDGKVGFKEFSALMSGTVRQ